MADPYQTFAPTPISPARDVTVVASGGTSTPTDNYKSAMVYVPDGSTASVTVTTARGNSRTLKYGPGNHVLDLQITALTALSGTSVEFYGFSD